MVDFLSPEERSRRMSRIRGKDTAPELRLRTELHRLGLRYRLHRSGLAGKPDLVFPGRRAVVFVHGCFWHRHAGCKVASIPKSNTSFWEEKFRRNVKRDQEVTSKLREEGWRVFVVWECELSSVSRAKVRAEALAEEIKKLDRA